MDQMPVMTVSSVEFQFDKGRKKMFGFSESFAGAFPQLFKMKSEHTGRIVSFKHVVYGDPLYDEDSWDGEQAIYRPVEKIPNVECLILSHAY